MTCSISCIGKGNAFVSVFVAPLLNCLSFSIPIQSIATNGPSLVSPRLSPHPHRMLECLMPCQVHKVRFVASTLLDAVRKAETAPASAARAHAYLCKFLPRTVRFDRHDADDGARDF